MGHEGCGIVESVGLGVNTVKAGDKVVMHWRPGDGIESPFPSYILDGKRISSGKVTTLSEYSIVSENRLTKIDPKTPTVLKLMLGCSMTTALGLIDNEINLKFGESVACHWLWWCGTQSHSGIEDEGEHMRSLVWMSMSLWVTWFWTLERLLPL